MQFTLEPGRYVAAVSGGVDSIVLLDILSQQSRIDLVVAHFDHGSRSDSVKDRQFVEQLAREYGLEFEYGEGGLGSKVSEAAARRARYEFLYAVQRQYHAVAIITAHHQDDVLETAILNILRGTYRRGLSSLRSTESIKRPLLDIPKAELIKYAKTHHLAWHEDSTNASDKYLRNYIRHQILPGFSQSDRHRLLEILDSTKQVNTLADNIISQILDIQVTGTLDRHWFEQLPHAVARDILAVWLNRQDVPNLDRRLLEELVVAAKTLPAGRHRDIKAGYILKIGKDQLALTRPER